MGTIETKEEAEVRGGGTPPGTTPGEFFLGRGSYKLIVCFSRTRRRGFQCIMSCVDVICVYCLGLIPSRWAGNGPRLFNIAGLSPRGLRGHLPPVPLPFATPMVESHATYSRN